MTCFGTCEFRRNPQGWVNTRQLIQNRVLMERLPVIVLFVKDDTGAIQWIEDSLLYPVPLKGTHKRQRNYYNRWSSRTYVVTIENVIYLAQKPNQWPNPNWGGMKLLVRIQEQNLTNTKAYIQAWIGAMRCPRPLTQCTMKQHKRRNDPGEWTSELEQD